MMLNSATGLKKKITQVIADSGVIPLEAGLGFLTSPIEKGTVLLETACFNETPLDTRKCVEIITEVIYLLTQGVEFSPEETTTLFFRATRLFQSNSNRLRRLTHLLIRSLNIVDAEAFIVTSSLTKDMSASCDFLRANAIRTLSRIVDSTGVLHLDRYMKAALVDKNPLVASTALVSTIQMNQKNVEVVRRWVNEATECLSSKHPVVQFHALALLYELKKNDRLAFHKIISQLTSQSWIAPMAECLLVRYSALLLATEQGSGLEASLIAFLESCLKHRADVVAYEAARAMVNHVLKTQQTEKTSLFVDTRHRETTATAVQTFPFDIAAVVATLQSLLSSPRSVVRYSAINTLNKLATAFPSVVSRCNLDIEPLLLDSDRLVAVMALTTMLKTTTETNVDRLIGQVASILSDLSEMLRLDLVTATTNLALTYPSKARSVSIFLAGQLREEGSLAFKQHLVSALEKICVVVRDPLTHDEALSHLCEFIEDCEYQNLCCRVISYMADEVIHAPSRARYLRYIFNRMILEDAPVRAAAVDAMARLAASCPELKVDVALLLRAVDQDDENEVRDRIHTVISILSQTSEVRKVLSQIASQDLSTTEEGDDDSSNEESDEVVLGDDFITQSDGMSIDALIDSMTLHSQREGIEAPFDFSSVPSEKAYREAKQTEMELRRQTHQDTDSKQPGSGVRGAKAPASMSPYVDSNVSETSGLKIVTNSFPEIDFGPLAHMTSSTSLTESEAEYVVSATKLMFLSSLHIVVDLALTNTLSSEVLEDVTIVPTVQSDARIRPIAVSNAPRVGPMETRRLFIVLKIDESASDIGYMVEASVNLELKFRFLEVGDPVGYDDSYEIEPLKIAACDYVGPLLLAPGQFEEVWNEMAANEQLRPAMARSVLGHLPKKLEDGISLLKNRLHMYPTDQSHICSNSNADAIMSTWAGKHTRDGNISHTILCQSQMVYSRERGVLVKLTFLSTSNSLATYIANNINLS